MEMAFAGNASPIWPCSDYIDRHNHDLLPRDTHVYCDECDASDNGAAFGLTTISIPDRRLIGMQYLQNIIARSATVLPLLHVFLRSQSRDVGQLPTSPLLPPRMQPKVAHCLGRHDK